MSSSTQRDLRRPAAAPEPPTGRQFVIRRAGQRAVVTEVGAALRSWRVDGRERLDTFGADELGSDFRGKALLPWPNRIRDARYVFRGIEHVTAMTEPERGCALHGLLLWVNWRALRRSVDRVTLGYVLHAQPGYPFILGLELDYRLTGAGLAVTLHAANLGATEAPFGAGFHPYLTLGGRIDDAVLQVPGRTRLPVGERLLPVGTPVRVDGVARVRLTAAEPERDVTVWMDESFRYVHVYTADAVEEPARRRGGIAVEPLTCAPDAFDSGEGLVSLAPGASFVGRWGLSPRWKEL